jgi:vitamin B12 transporter
MSLLLSFAVAAALSAQTEPRRQPTVVVTASRREQMLARTLAATTVINRADIEASGVDDIADLLRRQAGIDVARTGGSGQSTSVFMRGTNSNHVLVLIDGVRVASANTGAYTWEHLPLAQVEQIEIVRGPRAAYWGSDAIGGVIAITTRRAAGSAVQLSAGRWDRRAIEASHGVGDDTAGWSISAGHERLDGYSTQNAAGFSFDPDDDGYDRDALVLAGHRAFGMQMLAASALGTDARVEFDRGASRVDQHALSARLSGPLGDRWSHDLVVGSVRDRIETPDFFQAFDTRREQADWLHRVALGAHDDIVAGLNWQRDRGGNFSFPAGTANYAATRTNRALFVSAAGAREAFDHELSLRHDRNSAFGSATTSQVAGGLNIGPGRAHASWGQGFRAPNFNELYSPGFGGQFAGNPALEPERSRSAELGYAVDHGDWRVATRAWSTRIDDLVAFQAPGTFNAINIARARIDGVEIESGLRVDAWSLSGNLTWQDPEDASTGLDLLRRPARKATLGIERAFDGGGLLAMTAQYASERREFGGPLAPYTVVDLRWSMPLGHGFAAALELTNATDRDYELARGFNTPDRAFGMRLSWNSP